jgi:hypothetical protein
MKRAIIAVVAGFVAWLLAATLLNLGLRGALEGYAAAEPHMTFTLTMLAGRLIVGALSSLAAGAVAGAIAPRGSRSPWVLGAILLAAFLPEHLLRLWHVFPVWYHLTFLVSLVPLVVLGAQCTSRTPASAASGP